MQFVGEYRECVENLVVITWGCHGRWDGRHNTGASEPIWRGIVIVAKGKIMPKVPMS